MNHFYESIHGWFNFAPAYKRAVEEAKDGAVFVELGSWKGRSAAYMGVEIINSGKDISLICVDHWKGSDEEAHRQDAQRASLFEVFTHNMLPLLDAGLKLTTLICDSATAADGFEDESVDFIWVDAGHEYDEVSRDIAAWLPKLKPGCILGGDDYEWPGVALAVQDRLPGFQLEGDYPYWQYRKE